MLISDGAERDAWLRSRAQHTTLAHERADAWTDAGRRYAELYMFATHSIDDIQMRLCRALQASLPFQPFREEERPDYVRSPNKHSDLWYKDLGLAERELLLYEPGHSFRKATSRHSNLLRANHATRTRHLKRGTEHLLHGGDQDLTNSLTKLGFVEPSGLQEALPRQTALSVLHATQDPLMTTDQQYASLRTNFEVLPSECPRPTESYRPSDPATWPGAIQPNIFHLTTLILSPGSRAREETIYTESAAFGDLGVPPSGTFSCAVPLQRAADELLRLAGHSRRCPHLIIPCVFINANNVQEYVMVINYDDLHPFQHSDVGADDTPNALSQVSPTKLQPRTVDDYLNSMSQDHGYDTWYWALERLCLGGFLDQFMARQRHKRFTGQRLNSNDIRNPPTEHLATMWKLDRDNHWPAGYRDKECTCLDPGNRRIRLCYDEFCAKASFGSGTNKDLRAMRYPAWLLPKTATVTPGEALPTVEIDKLGAALAVLFDTGATADFIGAAAVQERELLTRACNSSVTLADNTRAKITQQAYLPIALVDPDGHPVSFSTWAYVLPGEAPETDVILGLPTLITKTGSLFLSYVKDLVDKYRHIPKGHSCSFLRNIAHQALRYARVNTLAQDSVCFRLPPDILTTEPVRVGSDLPTAHVCHGPDTNETVFVADAQAYEPDVNYPVFAVAVDADPLNGEAYLQAQQEADAYYQEQCEEFSRRHDAAVLLRTWRDLDREAREDIDTPLPTDFSEALRFGEMTPDEARQEFLDGFQQRIGKDALNNPETLEIMREHGPSAFVPQNWEGITNVTFKIAWKDTLPDSHKPKARPINPRLYEHAATEFKRLCTYMYEKHDGPWASPPAIAPKASKPFIRICGDYRWLNEHIQGQQGPIPDVRKLLDRIAEKRYVIDADLSNAFHQIRLDPDSSSKLSLQTPWGQFAPRFLPEGVKPGSHQLQKVVSDIFADFGDDVIVAFDNLLLLCNSIEHGNALLKKLLMRCRERNVFLKLSKTNIMVKECNFFGYKVTCADDTGRKGTIAIADDKREQIDAMPFPTNVKQMRSFIGSTVYYSNFIPHYSTVMAPLVDMTTDKFTSWNDEAVMTTKREAFQAYKDALASAMFLAYPDYSLPWTLRTDASQYGVGAVLFQTRTLPDGTLVHEPLYFVSAKFSSEATRWSTIEQECYAIYYALRTLEYYLWGKPVVIETDHNNLQYMEMSAVPKIVRWRIYIQSFMTMIKHIPGKLNQTADYLSRMFAPSDNPHALLQALLDKPVFAYDLSHDLASDWKDPDLPEWLDTLRVLQVRSRIEKGDTKDVNDDTTADNPSLGSQNCQGEGEKAGTTATPTLSDENILNEIHNARRGHMGAQRTWTTLQRDYPGHTMPYAFVEEYVRNCPVCQKFRLGRGKAYLPAQNRIIPVEHLHSSIGIDHLDLGEDTANGNRFVLVVRVHYSGLVKLYPVKNKDAETTARTLLKFYASFGLFDTLRCDQGADYTSHVIQQLHKWFGIPIRYSIVRRHESSGVEHVNREVRRHVFALLATEGLYGRWSDDTVLPVVEFIMNSTENSATGKKPFELHFGSTSAAFHRLSDAEQLADSVPNPIDFLHNLDANLLKLRAQALKLKQEYQAAPLKLNRPEQTYYQPGDLVLYDAMDLEALRNKNKHARWLGPYKVLKQTNNDVTCEDLLADKSYLFHVDSLKHFAGTLEEAQKYAQCDDRQFQVRKVHAHCGDQNQGSRKALQFLVEYSDGEVVLRDFEAKDLHTCKPFLDYCHKDDRKYLLSWTFATDSEAEKAKKVLNTPPNTRNIPWAGKDSTCYINLAVWNTGGWYDDLKLPGKFNPTATPFDVSQPFSTFWYQVQIQHPKKPERGKPYDYLVPILKVYKQDALFAASCSFVHDYILPELPPGGILVDEAFAKLHPQVMYS